MRFSPIILSAAALALVPAAAYAEEAKQAAAAEKSRDDYIAFANNGGVRNWRAEDRDTIYFQDRKRNWYRAELIGSATDLPFTLFIGLDTQPGDRLDRWSSIYVSGQRYQLRSFEKIDGQPPKKKKKAKDADASS